MTTTQHPELGSVPALIRAGIPDLNPSERRVAEVFVDRPTWTIEASAQEIADAAGTSRATVVRTAQRLGFTGYPQLRVLLARDVGLGSERPAAEHPHASDDAAGVFHAFLRDVALTIDDALALLDPADVRRAVDLLADAGQVLVVGNGLSLPVATEMAMRLNAIGRYADAPTDHVEQGVRARRLGPGDVCVVVSGSGSTRPTIAAARAASKAGAAVVGLTASSTAGLADIATLSLVVGLGAPSFRDDITRTSRLPQAIVAGGLVRALSERNPDAAREAQARMLDVIGEVFLQDPR
ncbi:MurR/RpiR family transcriptional regulator [Pseudactinotalea sp.]|uniref:MurR/RpiR family transcriptional regulator n=1 Tax=Pseudactinotalea sp. TaxID=1926260 RepID=UPI003B3A9A1B